MLKLIKAKVLGGRAVVSHAVPRDMGGKLTPGGGGKDQCVPFDYDIIDIDSGSSTRTTSSDCMSLPASDDETAAVPSPAPHCSTIDPDKSFAATYSNASKAREYTLVKTINAGSTAKVQLAIHEPTGQHVALKIMKKSRQHIKYMNREVSIHKQLDHENIVGLYDVIETPYHFVLAMEHLGGGDLFDLVPPNEGCTELQALTYLQQIVRPVAHMHARNVVHRDIKPENCVSDDDGNLKLIDFGAASAADGTSTPAGTIPYMAPEMFTMESGAKANWDLKAIDVWAMGVVYFTLLTGRFPWAVGNQDKSPEYKEYLQGTLTARYPWNKISPGSLHLLDRLLCVDPAHRVSASGAAELVDSLAVMVRAEQLKAARAMILAVTVDSPVPTAPMQERHVCKAA